MKPVFQTGFDVKTGNCYAACLASILEVPLDRIPVGLNDEKWIERANQFLAAFNLRTMVFKWEVGREWTFGPVWHVVSGPSPRGNWYHACVGFGGEIVHDPHPDGGGVLLGTEREIDIFVMVDPARARVF